MSNVTHPSHYNSGKIEVIEAIEDWKLNFHRGNAVKYVARAGKKDPSKEIEDLEKAVWYLNREIEVLRADRDDRDPVRPNDMNPKKTKVADRKKSILLYGPQGCGKTTHAKNLAKFFGLKNIVDSGGAKTKDGYLDPPFDTLIVSNSRPMNMSLTEQMVSFDVAIKMAEIKT